MYEDLAKRGQQMSCVIPARLGYSDLSPLVVLNFVVDLMFLILVLLVVVLPQIWDKVVFPVC